MYRAEFKSTKEVIYMDDLRSMIKYVSGVLRFHKSHLRGDHRMSEQVEIMRYNDYYDYWIYVATMFLKYDPCYGRLNWVSLRRGSCVAMWAREEDA